MVKQSPGRRFCVADHIDTPKNKIVEPLWVHGDRWWSTSECDLTHRQSIAICNIKDQRTGTQVLPVPGNLCGVCAGCGVDGCDCGHGGQGTKGPGTRDERDRGQAVRACVVVGWWSPRITRYECDIWMPRITRHACVLSLGSVAGSLIEPGPAPHYSEGGFFGAAPSLSVDLRKNWNSSQEKSSLTSIEGRTPCGS